MNCPKCKQGPLKSHKTKQGVLVNLCLKCKGFWLDKAGVLSLTRTSKKLENLIKYGVNTGEESDYLSPATGKKMVKFAFYPADIELEFCNETEGIWFESGELDKLNKAMPEPTTTAQNLDEYTILMEAGVSHEIDEDKTVSMDSYESVATVSPGTKQARSAKAIPSSISYELLEKIGAGGMGEVYKAKLNTNVGTSETVVIKKIKYEFSQNTKDRSLIDALTQKFKKETSIAAELNGHPHIVGFRGAELVDNPNTGKKEIFFVMEFVDGFDLSQLLRLHKITPENIVKGKANKVSSDAVGFILFRVANALDYAHNFIFSDGKKGILHLDISPGNILLNASLGLIKLSDFGVASSIEDLRKNREMVGMTGKPFYMCPEMLHGATLDFSSDLYSLGISIYQILTGICPNKIFNFLPKNHAEMKKVISDFLDKDLVPPHKIVKGINEELSTVLMRTMAPKKEERFRSASDLREDVGMVLYNKGFGPTDNSFALYLKQIIDFSGGKTKIDPHDLKGMKIEPLELYPDVAEKLAKNINPCRI